MPACKQMQPESYHKSATPQPSTRIAAQLFKVPSTHVHIMLNWSWKLDCLLLAISWLFI